MKKGVVGPFFPGSNNGSRRRTVTTLGGKVMKYEIWRVYAGESECEKATVERTIKNNNGEKRAKKTKSGSKGEGRQRMTKNITTSVGREPDKFYSAPETIKLEFIYF